MSEDTRGKSREACDLPAGGPLHEKGTYTTETLQPFEKMQPGEVDKVFQASCPKCDHRVWVFLPLDDGPISEQVSDPDARGCKNCGYVHWLRGPNVSEVIPLPTAAGPSKKDRVRALVFALIASPAIDCHRIHGSSIGAELVETALDLDHKIESIK
jgi:hypothetical protein